MAEPQQLCLALSLGQGPDLVRENALDRQAIVLDGGVVVVLDVLVVQRSIREEAHLARYEVVL